VGVVADDPGCEPEAAYILERMGAGSGVARWLRVDRFHSYKRQGRICRRNRRV
jgi:hypothetical protein